MYTVLLRKFGQRTNGSKPLTKGILDGGAIPPTSTIKVVMKKLKEKFLTFIEMLAEALKGVGQSL